MKKKKEPTGKERMLRPPPSDLSLRPKIYEFDVEKAYTPAQLAKIGAIALKWNQVEAKIEFLTTVAFQRSFSSFGMWLEMQKSIRSMDRQVSLLRAFANESKTLTDEAKTVIKVAFDAAIEYRQFRNAIVHSYVFDHTNGIANHIDHSDKPWQVLVTQEALNTLYSNLYELDYELSEVDLLFRMARGQDSVIVNDPATGKPEKDQQKALRERAVPDQVKKVIERQQKRQKMPMFPDVHLIVPKVGPITITPTEIE